jgi:hypothetical protein
MNLPETDSGNIRPSRHANFFGDAPVFAPVAGPGGGLRHFRGSLAPIPVTCEVLWPYDVNYPTPIGGEGGQLNRFINLPVEWQLQPSSGLDRMKVEALTFTTSQRNLNLAREAIDLFPSFGWPLGALRYLVPVFGSATPWTRELALVWAAGIPVANFWAFDHICLYNLDVPEPPLDRRSVLKTS